MTVDAESGATMTVEETVELSRPFGEPNMTTSSLETLQTEGQRELMDLVDSLRRSGLSTVLPLPQIVVVGDQSSGKSSLLEAITEIPFPRKESLCTRFATEISLRRGNNSNISCTIRSCDERTQEEKRKLESFSRSISNFEDLPSIVEEATALMGLGPSQAFSRDVLSINISGPGRPQLTIVDLPGLIHAANKSQSEDDIQLVKSLVTDYIAEKRTIILAVVSAKNDYANQIVLKMCRQYDPQGSRTLGVITKPDYLRSGSENESTWLDLAQNKDIYLELGWHLIKNREEGQEAFSFQQRNDQEQRFFNKGAYQKMVTSMKGVISLRSRLSSLLFAHLNAELPQLRDELDTMIEDVTQQLDELGGSRSTLVEQRVYLAKVATLTTNILRMGTDGTYEHEFFRKLDLSVPVQSLPNSLRIRAVVQHMNIRFAERMRLMDHLNQVTKHEKVDNAGITGESEDGCATSKPSKKKSKGSKMTREDMISRILLILERSRGRELAGTFDPLIIGQVFQEQSARWEQVARDHIVLIANACKEFVNHVLEQISAVEVRDRLRESVVMPALKLALSSAMEELGRILEDQRRHPITYNHYFTDTFQKLQRDGFTERITDAAQYAEVNITQKTYTAGPGFEEKKYIDPTLLKSFMQTGLQQNMSKFAAEQVLDAHEAFYKTEQKYFIDVVTKQIIERHLLTPLAEILSPQVVAAYSDRDVKYMAAEPTSTVQRRAHLKARQELLSEGQNMFEAKSLTWERR